MSETVRVPREGLCKLPHILVVEDNPGDVFLLRESLHEQGLKCNMWVLEDGEAALSHLDRIEQGAAEIPELMLLDLNLPKRTGWDVLRYLRGLRSLSRTAVVILSSSDSARDRAYAMAHGAALYIRKPLELEEYMDIGAVLRRVLERQAHAAAEAC